MFSPPPGTLSREPGGTYIYRSRCPACGMPSEVRGLRKTAYDRWRKGDAFDDALPDLSPAEREILLSGLHSACFDAWTS
jgi:hypothetical protein